MFHIVVQGYTGFCTGVQRFTAVYSGCTILYSIVTFCKLMFLVICKMYSVVWYCVEYFSKLDGVGPVDNRPSTD